MSSVAHGFIHSPHSSSPIVACWAGCLQSVPWWHMQWMGESSLCGTQCSGFVLSTATRHLGYSEEYRQLPVDFLRWVVNILTDDTDLTDRPLCRFLYSTSVDPTSSLTDHCSDDPSALITAPRKYDDWLLLLCNLTHCLPVPTNATPMSNLMACVMLNFEFGNFHPCSCCTLPHFPHCPLCLSFFFVACAFVLVSEFMFHSILIHNSPKVHIKLS